MSEEKNEDERQKLNIEEKIERRRSIWGDILVSLAFNINLRGLFNAKAILIEEQKWYSLTHSWGGDKNIRLQVNLNKAMGVRTPGHCPAS